MSFCDCTMIDRTFDPSTARRDLRRFRRRGPAKQTRALLDGIQQTPLPEGATLLDIGGGIGAIHHVLLDKGFSHATQIDAAVAYLDASKDETQRLGHTGRVTFRHGDFHDLVQEAPDVDVVTLDRVVCCDADYRTMLGGAADRAKRLVAFTYPRPRAATRAFIAAANWFSRTFLSGFQAYVHPPEEMARVLEEHGMRRRSSGGTFIWAAEVFER
jgi:2-polyprenyl-3-methyl-5-hydroxy-6-metoxy-1,4-benzoquinol methylase